MKISTETIAIVAMIGAVFVLIAMGVSSASGAPLSSVLAMDLVSGLAWS